MRVIENHSDHELYSVEVRARVETVFYAASQISALRSVLTQVKAEAVNLRRLFLTEKDQKEIREKLRDLDTTIRNSHYCISKYLETYLESKWSEIIDKEKNE